jgi:hypothetical protein
MAEKPSPAAVTENISTRTQHDERHINPTHGPEPSPLSQFFCRSVLLRRGRAAQRAARRKLGERAGRHEKAD